MGFKHWVMGNGSQVTGYGLQVYWTVQQHFGLNLHICQVVELVVSPEPGVSLGSMQGVTLAANASESFTLSVPDPKGTWQCNPMGRGVLETSKSSK